MLLADSSKERRQQSPLLPKCKLISRLAFGHSRRDISAMQSPIQRPPLARPRAVLLGQAMGNIAGPMVRDTRPALTKAQMYIPQIGLRVGLDTIASDSPPPPPPPE